MTILTPHHTGPYLSMLALNVATRIACVASLMAQLIMAGIALKAAINQSHKLGNRIIAGLAFVVFMTIAALMSWGLLAG